MLEHLLVALIAPVLRRLLALLLAVMAGAFLMTIPTRLWVRYVDSYPSEQALIVLNSMSIVLIGGLSAPRFRRRTRQAGHR
ncbi:MAG: hypothetical protein ACR2HK_09940 [Gemmatimonadales bacterium]